MKSGIRLVLTLAAAAALVGPAPAIGAGTSRVNGNVALTSAAAGRARLAFRRDGPGRMELGVTVVGAARGLDLRVFVADAQGALVEVGSMTERRGGRYQWLVRTAKGDALPFGQSDLSGLSLHAVEVRTAAGATEFSGAFPAIRPARAPRHTTKALRTNLAVNRSTAAAIGAPNLTAQTLVGLSRRGRQQFGVHVGNAAPGQTFTVWVQDPVTGAMTYLSTITAGASLTKSDSVGGDDGADDGSDDATDEGDVEYDSENGDDLPDGATSVSELAGLNVEIDDDAGDVVATGEIASVGDGARADDDNEDGTTDGEEADDGGDDGADD